MYQRDKPYDGILQRFVDPKGTNNQVYRIVWSPKICVFERRENMREITDHKYSLYERVVTFEGEEFHSRLCNPNQPKLNFFYSSPERYIGAQ